MDAFLECASILGVLFISIYPPLLLYVFIWVGADIIVGYCVMAYT